MKFNFVALLTVVAITFGIQSCKKDSATSGVTTPPLITAPVLTNVYFIDTTVAHPKDTLGRYILTYDSQGRPDVVTFGEVSINGDSLDANSIKYYYNGNDTFVYKTDQTSRSFSGATYTTSGETHFYKFLNQQMVSDSGTNSRGSHWIVKYSYYPSYFKLSTTGVLVNPGSSVLYTINNNIYQTQSGGNISYQLDTAITAAPFGTNYDRLETTVTFSPNPNPFYKIILPVNKQALTQYIGIFNESAAQKNLVLQQTADFHSWTSPAYYNTTNFSQVNYTYTYRPDGYPSEARHAATSSDYPAGYVQRAKIIFVYK